jgi:hypothetical protein
LATKAKKKRSKKISKIHDIKTSIMKKRFLKVISLPLALLSLIPMIIIVSVYYILTGKESPGTMIEKYVIWLDS